MAIRIGINGFGRIGRFLPRSRRTRSSKSSRSTTSPTPRRSPTSSSTTRSTAASRARAAGADADRQRQDDQGPRRQGSRRAALEGPGRGHRRRVHRAFTDREGAGKHIAAGAKKVIISAPAKDADLTVVLRRQRRHLRARQAPHRLQRLLHHQLPGAGREGPRTTPSASKRGLMTTIHSYTNDQKILDFPHKDLRRARAAAISMIPTTTGAAKAIGLVMPELKGKLDGFSIRVPTPNVSVVDLVVELEHADRREGINAALKAASKARLKGILDYTDEPLVSIDFCGDSRLLDRGRRLHQGHRRQPGQGPLLVRQRDGLHLPAPGPDHVHGRQGMTHCAVGNESRPDSGISKSRAVRCTS